MDKKATRLMVVAVVPVDGGHDAAMISVLLFVVVVVVLVLVLVLVFEELRISRIAEVIT